MKLLTYLLLILIGGWLYSLYRKSNSRHAPRPTEAAPRQSFATKAVGVTYHNPGGTNRQQIIQSHCRPGEPIQLKPEPDNQHDPNAVALWLQQGQIGYLPSGRTADEVADYLRRGTRLTANVINVTGGTADAPTLGVNLQINIWQD